MARTCAILLMSTSGASCHGRESPGVQPPRTCASGSHRRERSSPPQGATCQGCNPRELPGVQPPRTRVSLLMSTSEASVSPAGSVGPGRSPLGTRTPRREMRAQALGRFARPPPRTCAILSHRRGVQPPPSGANCLGCNPRELPGVQPPRIVPRGHAPRTDSGGTPPRIESPGTGP